jgi:hypothetical protein
MCRPNDPEARDILVRTFRNWGDPSRVGPSTVPKGLGRIQHDWLRVADIFHLHSDLIHGQHQARRGGASIGKAITLAQANTESRGSGAATLWDKWSTYKDVAHLVTAATVVCAEARTRLRDQPLAPDGLKFTQFVPFQMTMLLPDLVIAIGLEFERLGLDVVPHARTESTLDPDALWRIPPDINVAPLPPPIRKVRQQDVMVLNSRRAGNRGKANARKQRGAKATTYANAKTPTKASNGEIKRRGRRSAAT